VALVAKVQAGVNANAALMMHAVGLEVLCEREVAKRARGRDTSTMQAKVTCPLPDPPLQVTFYADETLRHHYDQSRTSSRHHLLRHAREGRPWFGAFSSP
jgi:propanediol dehydratase large subunit